MSERVWIRDLGAHLEEEVRLLGWVRLHRSSGKLHFVELRDGTGTVQVVVKAGAASDDAIEAVRQVTIESSVEVEGVVLALPRQEGVVEVSANTFRVLGPTTDDYPLGKKDHGIGFLLDHRHLWLRSRRPSAILRIRAHVIRACREHLDGQGFVGVDAPILNSAAAEGTATLFPVEYYDAGVFPPPSPQLHMEAAAQALGRVYCFGPTFRAEKSKTRRHLTEFWMLEPEIAFGNLDDAMDLGESLVAHVLERVLEECAADLDALERDRTALERAAVRPYPRITYDEALATLEGTDEAIPWGEDFGAPQEDRLSISYETPVLVHRYPAAVKAFYMRPDPDRPELALGCDMIAPEGYGEIVGGGERSGDLAFLEAQIAKEDLPKEAYEWYLDLRRYGACPSSGFGLGLERTIAWICGLAHIREAAPFPRTIYRTKP